MTYRLGRVMRMTKAMSNRVKGIVLRMRMMLMMMTMMVTRIMSSKYKYRWKIYNYSGMPMRTMDNNYRIQTKKRINSCRMTSRMMSRCYKMRMMTIPSSYNPISIEGTSFIIGGQAMIHYMMNSMKSSPLTGMTPITISIKRKRNRKTQ